MDLDSQIDFCEKQIANLTKLYIHLVNLKSGKPVKTKKVKQVKQVKQIEQVEPENDEIEDVLNFIEEIAEQPASVPVPVSAPAPKTINGNGVALDDLTNDTDFEQLLKVRKDRKAISDEFEERRLKIVAEEKELIASGVSENDAREIMRRKYYPGSIAKIVMSAEDMRIERLKLKEQGYTEEQAEEKLKIQYPDYAFNKIADAEQSDDDPDDIVDEIVLAQDN